MSTGGPDPDLLVEIDGDMHRLTSRLRWRDRAPAERIFTVMVFTGRRSRETVLEQAWQNVRTGALVWRAVEIEP